MGVATLPPVLPGSMIVWIDAFDRVLYGLVIQFVREETHYSVTMVHDERIKTLTLEHKENGRSWRVMCHDS